MERTSAISQSEKSEIKVCISFIQKVLLNSPHLNLDFHTATLSSAINQACVAQQTSRKALLLYLHSDLDPFSSIFWKVLHHSEVAQALKQDFFMLGWDIEDVTYHSALIEALNASDLDSIVHFVKNKICAGVIIVSLNGIVTPIACLRQSIEPQLFLEYIKSAREYLEEEGNTELKTCTNFIKTLKTIHPHSQVNFQISTLKNAIEEACITPQHDKKMILLYLHNNLDAFSTIFLDIIHDTRIAKTLKDSCYLLGWDLENPTYHSALVKALESNDLGIASKLIEDKITAVLILLPIAGKMSLSMCIRGDVTANTFLESIKKAEIKYRSEVEQEDELRRLENEKGHDGDIDSEKFQTMIASMLGDRDYDCFEYNQHEFLKDKIGFAFYGPPTSENGYDKKQQKKINTLYQQIVRISSKIVEYRDRIEISFIYACIEPLPAEKLAKSKKDSTYNPKTDLMPLPIFVLRKCRESEDPCRVFIDHTGRTYAKWSDYIIDNKLHECMVILPKNGRYEFAEDGTVLLESHLSPACNVAKKVLKGADYAVAATGVISGGALLIPAFTALAFPPAALVAAVTVGAGAGIYSIARSSMTLYDRIAHKETMSFANSEARGAYINIIAGSLGFVGMGANMAVSQLVTRGVNIAEGGMLAVTTLNVANVSMSGISVVNTGYDMVDQWISDNQTPSSLAWVQLATSVLFFGNAVFNFKTCRTIIDETQTKALESYQNSLRSNRHRRTFNKLLKETIRLKNGNESAGRAEVIASIRNIPNKDEVFAVLTRSNKELNEKGIRFSAEDGHIKLNGMQIDMNEFAALNKGQRNSFLSNMPKNVITTEPDVKSSISNTFSSYNINVNVEVLQYAVKMFAAFNGDIRTAIIEIVAKVMKNITFAFNAILDEIFPNRTKYIGIIDMVIGYISKQADELEDRYKKYKSGNMNCYHPWFEKINLEEARRWLWWFEKCVVLAISPETTMKKLMEEFRVWFTKLYYDYQTRQEQRRETRVHSAGTTYNKIGCNVCKGHYYSTKK